MFLWSVVALLGGSEGAEVPRGVSHARAAFYQPSPDNTFTCLDGKNVIPFDQVNDDFCDCEDGSDEPGTSACGNGHFHCANDGFKPLNLLSSRVNDMICDCCDGSDEWEGHVKCENTCEQHYQEYYAEQLKNQADQQAGFESRQQLAVQAQGAKAKLADEKAQIETELDGLRAERAALEELKIQAEEKESAERDRLDEEKAAKVVARAGEYPDDELAEIGFDFLDSNNNEQLNGYEVQSKKYLNPDQGAAFTTKEAKALMGDKDPLELDDFKTILWPEIKEKLIPKLGDHFDTWEARKKAAEEAANADPEAEPEPEQEPETEAMSETEEAELKEDAIEQEDEFEALDEEGDWDDEDDWDDYGDDYDYDEHHHTHQDNVKNEINDDLSPETRAIFDAAKEARDNFNAVNDKHRDAQDRVNAIDDQLKFEFGPDDVFITMYKECYEFKTGEYIYKICPYDKASQKPLNGGSETNLGRWEGWNEDFTEMKFTHGTRCWNGPDRSATVKVKCGKEHKILGVDEPNRCEYEYKFETPAVCSKPQPIPEHDEL